jgi:hypothetical protein
MICGAPCSCALRSQISAERAERRPGCCGARQLPAWSLAPTGPSGARLHKRSQVLLRLATPSPAVCPTQCLRRFGFASSSARRAPTRRLAGRLGHMWPYVNGVALANPGKITICLGSDGSQVNEAQFQFQTHSPPSAGAAAAAQSAARKHERGRDAVPISGCGARRGLSARGRR